MARAGKPVIRIATDYDGRGVKDAEGSLDRLDRSGTKSLHGLKTAALGAGAALTAGVIFGAKKSADAAIEAEKANTRLETQLRAVGISYSKHADEIQKVIDKTSQLSGLDDEDLGDAFTNIIRVTGDLNKSFKLTGLAADFARAKQMDVAKAGEIVGKVAGGNTGILSRYGISIEKGATASEALALLQEKFAGQAEQYGKSTAGSADRASVALENLGESAGAGLTPFIADAAETFQTFVRQMTLGEGPGGRVRDVIEDVGGAAGAAAGEIGQLASGFQQGEPKARLLAAAIGGVATSFVAFKTGGAIAAGIDLLKTKWGGLTRFIQANPIGAVAIGVTALVTALGILSVKTESASADSRAFTTALGEQRDALREVQGIELDVAQRRANLKSATVAVEQAEHRLHTLRKDESATALDVKQGEADLKQARIGQRRAAVDLANAEDDGHAKRVRLKQATNDLTGEEQKLNGRIIDQIVDRRKEIAGIEDSIAAVRQQGGDYKTLTGTVDHLRQRQRRLRDEINALQSHKVDVSVNFKLSPSAGSVFGSGGVGDGPGKAVRASVSKVAQRAFASGQLGIPNLGGFGGGLHGANPGMGGIAALGGRFGLGITAGKDDHSPLTSTGHPSWHGSGEALDMSDGVATPHELAFAQFMASSFGGRLAELIHTPLGFSIKNGRRVAPIAAADHYDHVHVAMDLGRPGIGIGDGTGKGGKFSATSYGPPWGGIQGTGVTATGVDLRPAKHAFGIAVDPKRLKLGRNYYVWPNPFGRRGAFKAFDTGGAIKGNRIDFYDWRGRKSQLGWGSRQVTVSDDPALNSSAGGAGSKVKGPAQGKFGGGPKSGGKFKPRYDIDLKKIDRDAALASLTPGDADDIAVADRRVGYWRSALKRAQGTKSIGDDTTAAQGLRSALDEREGFNDTSTDNAGQALLQQMVELTAEKNARDARLEKLIAGQTPILADALMAMFSTGIGGGLALAYQTPSYAGGVASYGQP